MYQETLTNEANNIQLPTVPVYLKSIAPKLDLSEWELLEPHKLKTHYLMVPMSYTIGGKQDNFPCQPELASDIFKNSFSDKL